MSNRIACVCHFAIKLVCYFSTSNAIIIENDNNFQELYSEWCDWNECMDSNFRHEVNEGALVRPAIQTGRDEELIWTRNAHDVRMPLPLFNVIVSKKHFFMVRKEKRKPNSIYIQKPHDILEILKRKEEKNISSVCLFLLLFCKYNKEWKIVFYMVSKWITNNPMQFHKYVCVRLKKKRTSECWTRRTKT